MVSWIHTKISYLVLERKVIKAHRGTWVDSVSILSEEPEALQDGVHKRSVAWSDLQREEVESLLGKLRFMVLGLESFK